MKAPEFWLVFILFTAANLWWPSTITYLQPFMHHSASSSEASAQNVEKYGIDNRGINSDNQQSTTMLC